MCLKGCCRKPGPCCVKPCCFPCCGGSSVCCVSCCGIYPETCCGPWCESGLDPAWFSWLAPLTGRACCCGPAQCCRPRRC